jgi:hypothetical protein
MLKLYKQTPEGTQYWEAWQDTDKLVTHWGTLGDKGQSVEMPLGDDETEEAAIARESEPLRASGFVPIEPIQSVVISYSTSGWRPEALLDKRYRVEGLMNEILGWSCNGYCDGSDMIGGRINIVCVVIEAQIAAQTAIDALRKEGLLEGAAVAIKFDIENEEEEYQVRWPEPEDRAESDLLAEIEADDA